MIYSYVLNDRGGDISFRRVQSVCDVYWLSTLRKKINAKNKKVKASSYVSKIAQPVKSSFKYGAFTPCYESKVAAYAA